MLKTQLIPQNNFKKMKYLKIIKMQIFMKKVTNNNKNLKKIINFRRIILKI